MHLSLCPLLTIIVQQESSIPWKSSPPGKQWKAKSSWIYKVTRQKPGEKTKLQRKYLQIHSLGSGWSSQLLISQKTSPPRFRDNIWPHNSCDIKSMLFTFSHLMSSHLTILSLSTQLFHKHDLKWRLNFTTSLHYIFFFFMLYFVMT